MASRLFNAAQRNGLSQYIQAERLSLPTGRIDAAETARILGFQEHDIPVLVSCRLLKPLGNPVPNAKKYFSAGSILELAYNDAWLNRATQAVYDYWTEKNANRTKPEPEALPQLAA